MDKINTDEAEAIVVEYKTLRDTINTLKCELSSYKSKANNVREYTKIVAKKTAEIDKYETKIAELLAEVDKCGLSDEFDRLWRKITS